MMHRIIRITAAERDAILASSYPFDYTIESAYGHGPDEDPYGDGRQGVWFAEGTGVGVPPMEYTIKAGDHVTVWWSDWRGYGAARAIAINGGPPLIYPGQFGDYDAVVVVVEEDKRRAS